jgi:hypothetical protein
MRVVIFTLLLCVVGIARSNGQYFFLSPKIINSHYTGTPNEGTSIALSGDGNTMMVGATLDSFSRGSVFVYNNVNGVWTEDTTLTPEGHFPYPISASYPYEGFGTAIAMSYNGNTALIGRSGDNRQGAVWAYERDSFGKWHDASGRIGIPDPSNNNTDKANFGAAIDMAYDGTVAVVGAPQYNNINGAIYVIRRSNTGVWAASSLPGSAGGNYGNSVSIAGNGQRIVSLSPNYNIIFVYDNGPTGWIYKGQLPYTPPVNSLLSSVDLSYSGDTVAIGGLNLGVSQPGVAALAYNGNTWTQFGGNITIVNSAILNLRVKISGDSKKIAIGLPYENNNVGGCAYTVLDSNGIWTTPLQLIASGTTGQAHEGRDISLSADGNTLAAGAYADNNGVGAAYIHNRGIPHLTIDSVHGSPFCLSTSYQVSIPFTTNITGGNYDVSLSDTGGSFANAQTIGSGSANPIQVNISQTALKGSHYHLRLTYTGNGNLNNNYTGDADTTNLFVNTCFNQGVAGIAATILNIYPNPATNILNINNLVRASGYRILNTVGTVVQTGRLSASQAAISINLSEGLYFVQLTDNLGVIGVYKFMVQ